MQNSDNSIVVEVDPATDEEYDYPTPDKRPKPWLFQPGKSYNPGGRPKGKTLKDWGREYLAGLTDEERFAFFSGINKIDLWRMIEGNPSEDKNITVSVPRPILGGITQSPTPTLQGESKHIGHITATIEPDAESYTGVVSDVVEGT